MRSPSIIILVPSEFGFSDIFEKNFANEGFSVYNMTSILKFRYSGIFQKISKFFHQAINSNYKKKLIKNFQSKKIAELYPDFSKTRADYCLIIRPDLWDYEIVKKTIALANYSVGYQWDGFSRYPAIHHYISLFDSFFAFDVKDISYHIRLSTNFYFDIPPIHRKNIYDGVIYIGTYNESRLRIIKRLILHFKEEKIAFKFILFFDNKHDMARMEPTKDIEFISQQISYEKSLSLIAQYSTILDLQNSFHSGLSFRHFEAMPFRKKIITNNPMVINYDFYKKDNTFIMNDHNFQNLTQFLGIPFAPYQKEIIDKYSFANWYRYMLNIQPFISLGDDNE